MRRWAPGSKRGPVWRLCRPAGTGRVPRHGGRRQQAVGHRAALDPRGPLRRRDRRHPRRGPGAAGRARSRVGRRYFPGAAGARERQALHGGRPEIRDARRVIGGYRFAFGDPTSEDPQWVARRGWAAVPAGARPDAAAPRAARAGGPSDEHLSARPAHQAEGRRVTFGEPPPVSLGVLDYVPGVALVRQEVNLASDLLDDDRRASMAELYAANDDAQTYIDNTFAREDARREANRRASSESTRQRVCSCATLWISRNRSPSPTGRFRRPIYSARGAGLRDQADAELETFRTKLDELPGKFPTRRALFDPDFDGETRGIVSAAEARRKAADARAQDLSGGLAPRFRFRRRLAGHAAGSLAGATLFLRRRGGRRQERRRPDRADEPDGSRGECRHRGRRPVPARNRGGRRTGSKAASCRR